MRRRMRSILTLVTASIASLAVLPSVATAEPVAALSGGSTTPYVWLFDTDRPTQTTRLAITGIGAGETVEGLDVRPATGETYLVTSEDPGVGTDTGRIYKLDLGTGAATIVGTTFSTAIKDGAVLSIDFNPTVDRIRITSNLGDNFRVHPDTGALVGLDTDLSVTGIGAIAYDRNVAGATQTTLYAIDTSGTEQLATIGGVNSTPSPNGGVVTNIGPVGVTLDLDTGLDISGSTGIAYLLGGTPAGIRTVNLTTGATTVVNASVVGALTDLTVLPASTIAFPAATQVAEESLGRVDVTIVRTGSTKVAGSVDYATADGTAKAGVDYSAASGTVYFAAGEASKVVSIPVVDDGTGDANETFAVTLKNPTSAVLGTSTLTVTTVETFVADVTPPSVVVSDLGLKAYRFYYPNGLASSFSCNKACKVVYTVRIGTAYIAKNTGELTKAGVGTITAKNTLLGKARLSKAMKSSRVGVVKALLTLQATDANGRKTTVQRSFQILR